MCGIFGFTTSDGRESSVVIQGLKELEYRGYDSWGVAVARDRQVLTEKKVGKIGDACSQLPAGSAALGHTRWATHGGVTHENAHPHVDCGGRFAVIHNGIVENHTDLRAHLAARHVFRSETDTEAVVHLLEEEMASAKEGPQQLTEALMAVFRQIHGLSAIAVLDARTGRIAAAKNGSPLVIGWTDDGCYLASDPVALLAHTRRLVFVEDGQAASLEPSGPQIFDIETGQSMAVEVRTVDWVAHDSSLGMFDHYMDKEINEQPGVLRQLAASKASEVRELAAAIHESSSVFIIGCGTANHAGLVGQYLFSTIADRMVTPVLASEMALAVPALGRDSLVIALSQSGETADVLDAVKLASRKGARIAALTNSEGSSLYRMSQIPILLDCGPERCVLATKTYTAKLAILMMTAYELAGRSTEGVLAVAQGAALLEAFLVGEADHRTLDRLASSIQTEKHIFILGRHTNYPLALEAALKIKEVSYIHAEGFASGELKHGVIALVEPGTPCLIFATEPATIRDTLSGASEVRARGAITVGFCQDDYAEFDIHIPIQGEGPGVIFEVAAAFQTLAYRLALRLERDPDKPRNLAKSVTVK